MTVATRRAVVTGGAGAIGVAICDALRPAHDVVVLDRDEVDLASGDDVRRAAGEVGSCDVLVHAAAAFDRAPLESMTLETWRHVQSVNVESALLLAQAFAPGMRERGWGRVVFIVSDTVWSPPAPDLLAYVSSKATLIGMARVLALSLGESGITVNCVAPGLTRTPAAEVAVPEEEFEAVRSRQALPRTLEPVDVAGAVAFLASDAAAAFTGQTLNADGGLVMR
jgi:3-oxoacyl-[acyl-carrier protein] reductase